MIRAIAASLLLVSATSAIAQQVKQVEIVDFLVDWRDYIGKTPIVITGGTVIGAKAEGAVLWVRAGSVALSPPWAEKEDLRFLLNHCTGLDRKPECSVSVGGYVDDRFGSMPRLTGVDFYIQ